MLRNGKAKDHYISLDASGEVHRKNGVIIIQIFLVVQSIVLNILSLTFLCYFLQSLPQHCLLQPAAKMNLPA